MVNVNKGCHMIIKLKVYGNLKLDYFKNCVLNIFRNIPEQQQLQKFLLDISVKEKMETALIQQFFMLSLVNMLLKFKLTLFIGTSHFIHKHLNSRKNDVIFHIFIRFRFHGFCRKSGMPLYIQKVTLNYVDSPFKILMIPSKSNLSLSQMRLRRLDQTRKQL